MNIRFYRNLVILNGFIPALILAWDGYRGQLGANTANNALHITGILSLVFLFLSLIVTPLRAMTGWNSLVAYRRALGLYGFFYAAAHFGIYVVLDRMGSLSSTIEEILSRRFLLVGFIALTLMLPLAVTSTNAMIRKLGAVRWKILHRLAYIAAILGVVHYYMLVKSDVRQPLAFAAALTPILGFRSVKHYIDLRRKALGSKAKVASTKVSPKFFNGELLIANIHQETRDVKTFRFVNPAGGDIPFVHQPGQYMNLVLTIDGESVRRSYTIASAPSQRGHIELTIKRDPLGVASQFMHDRVNVGDRIRIGAPAGKFFFNGSEADAVVLVSGGVGITPLMSILRYLTDRAWDKPIYFINALRSPEDFIFERELNAIVQRFDNVRVLNCFSQSVPMTATDTESDRWKNFSGYIDAEGLRSFVPELSTAPIFLCGPDSMMQGVRRAIVSLGISGDKVSTEEFVSPKTARLREPAKLGEDSTMTQVTTSLVTFAASGLTIEVSAEHTILEAAESSDIELPYECRSGVCGQCKVRCSSGRVQMESRDALSTSEEANGYILACQARPASELITIEA